MRAEDETRLRDLLLTWEERRESGQPVPLAELCARDPHLIGPIRRCIQALQVIDRLVADEDGRARRWPVG